MTGPLLAHLVERTPPGEAVGPDLAIPEGAEVIDLGDATLSPGFIDAHTHPTVVSTDDRKRGFGDTLHRELSEEAIESTVPACAGRRIQ